MALNFPANPVDGDIYPDPAPEGSQQYVYNSTKGTWLTIAKGVQRVTASVPLFTTGSQSFPNININAATSTAGGFMSAADKTKLDSLGPSSGTVQSITAGTGLGAPNTGAQITTTGTINLIPPTLTTIGGIRGGTTVSVSAQGILDVNPAGTTVIGGVKQGTGVSISSDGTLSLAPNATYTILDNIASQFDGTKTVFQMTVNSVPFAPVSVNALMIFIGGVIQVPLSSFTVTGSSLVFSSPPPAGASFYGISLS
jgi:hypothetical protein